ncbi:MAG TPA: cytochrome c oxidase assembly protein [Alphaproteobacteria bacterium]|nr:cytochrome c oxidase assembly protein [Alphaproteobacteria bacterium]
MSGNPRSRANARVAFLTVGVVVGMAGLAFASVPLYRLFCQVTGYGGTPQRAEHAPDAAGEREVTVRFNADIAGTNLPWTFTPVEREVKVRVGEERLIHYRATNKGATPVVGTATFNVTPAKAGIYFQKIACFCFSEQTLAPGESVDMPVSFFIDPDIVKDPNTRDVSNITLSYTFFRAKHDADKLARSPANGEAARPAN